MSIANSKQVSFQMFTECIDLVTADRMLIGKEFHAGMVQLLSRPFVTEMQFSSRYTEITSLDSGGCSPSPMKSQTIC